MRNFIASNVYGEIRQAILDRNHVIINYHGLERQVCPHAIGKGPKGNDQFLGVQFGGQSSSGGLVLPPGKWRCFAVEEIESIRVEAGAWYTLPNHSRKQTCIEYIDIEVRY